MKILYSAIDQTVPAAHGGSVHVTSVAEGLAALGHEVHVLVSPGDRGEFPPGQAQWFSMPPPLGNRRLRLASSRRGRFARASFGPTSSSSAITTSAAKAFSPRGSRRAGVLEVNAPVVDHPGSPKRLVDRALIVEPLRRWRDWQCRRPT